LIVESSRLSKHLIHSNKNSSAKSSSIQGEFSSFLQRNFYSLISLFLPYIVEGCFGEFEPQSWATCVAYKK